jgi:hypothetical protein
MSGEQPGAGQHRRDDQSSASICFTLAGAAAADARRHGGDTFESRGGRDVTAKTSQQENV